MVADAHLQTKTTELTITGILDIVTVQEEASE